MSFDDLPPQSPMQQPGAEPYGQKALARSREAVRDLRAATDVAYGPDYWQKIDIYMPKEEQAAPLPVLLFAHGGGWTHGYKEWMGLMAPPIAELPAILVSVNYRLAPEHRYPVPAEDCAEALAWVFRNIARYGGDPNRLYTGGHSAGGHLYALVSLRRDMLAARNLPADVVKGCFPVSSQMDFQFAVVEPGSSEERIHKMLLHEGKEAREASPIAWVEGATVPFYLTCGGVDFPRIIRSSKAMAEALGAAGCHAELDVRDGFDHFDTALDLGSPQSPWIRRLKQVMTGSGGAQVRSAVA